MQIDRRYKNIVKIPDPSGRSFDHPHLDVEKKRLLATDGHCAVIVPCVPAPTDTTGAISVDTIKTAVKNAPKIGDLQIDADTSLRAYPGPIAMPRPTQDSYPDIDQVMPQKKPGEKGTVTISLNANLLAKVANVVSEKGIVTLTVNLSDLLGPILITAEHSPAYGCVMPYRAKEKQFTDSEQARATAMAKFDSGE